MGNVFINCIILALTFIYNDFNEFQSKFASFFKAILKNIDS